MMANLVQWVESEANGQPIIGVVIGEPQYGCRIFDVEPVINQLITWESAKPLLDVEFDCDYGGAECPPITAWTDELVITVHEYDGSTRIGSVPRNPCNHSPKFGG